MNTEVTTTEPTEAPLVTTFDPRPLRELQEITDAKIEVVENEYMPIVVKGLDDKAGYAMAKDAKRRMVTWRTSTDKLRLKAKREAINFGRVVDGEARRIFAKMLPIEEHLKTQLKVIDDEKKRLAQEIKEAAEAKTRQRINDLVKVGAAFDIDEIAALSDDHYEKVLAAAVEAHEAEKKRLADEEQARKEETARLAKQREEQEERDRIQQEKEDKLKADQEAFDKKKRDDEAAQDKKRRDEDAKLKAERDTLEKEKREARDAEQKRRRDLLWALGLQWDGSQFYYDDINVHWTDILALDPGEFDNLSTKLKKRMGEIKAAEKQAEDDKKKRIAEEAEEKAKKEADGKRRMDLLNTLDLAFNGGDYSYNGKVLIYLSTALALTSEGFDSMLVKVRSQIQSLKDEAEKARLKKIEDDKIAAEKADKKKADRKAALRPDKVKLIGFIDDISGIMAPSLKSTEAQDLLSDFGKRLTDLHIYMNGKIEALK